MSDTPREEAPISDVNAREEHDGKAPGLFGGQDERLVRQGGINQGTDPGEYARLSPAEQAEYRRRQMIGDLTDDNAASHQGGMGAQGGAVDFGSAGNLAGGVATRTR